MNRLIWWESYFLRLCLAQEGKSALWYAQASDHQRLKELLEVPVHKYIIIYLSI